MSNKVFDGKYTLEQLRQNMVIMQAKEVELPRKWLIELILLAQEGEGQQAEITQLKAKLELCREVIEACGHYMPDVGHFCACGTCKDCGKQIPYVGYEYCVECVREKMRTALEAIEVRNGE